MKIKKLHIDNFRNLNDITINFNQVSNYLIGENNLGKSNLLDALNCFFNNKKFEDEDFYQADKSIEISITLILNDFEKGFFGDNFSPENSSEITIQYRQGADDSFPTATCLDTEEPIQTKQLKKLHYVRYASTSAPTKELKIDSSNTAGKVFSGITSLYLKDETHNIQFLNEDSITELSAYINEHLSRIKGFSQYGIKATVAEKSSDMLSSLFYLSDDKRKIETTGSGIQYVAMVTLNIVSQILNIFSGKAVKAGEQTYTDERGKKILPIVVALDEPEVHLHPYLQRSLVNYYKNILANRDEDFLRLLHECFGIDGLDGQLIVVTHSSDILVDDYRNIIRFYKISETTQVVSGMSFENNFDKAAQKQLLMHFHELREAFYSHCIIFVEGETEYGCMSYLAEKAGFPLDDNCISIIMARGESSIKPLKKLMEYFKIPTVSVYDRDVYDKRNADDGINMFTTERCFEVEIIKTLYSKEKSSLVRSIAVEMNPQAETSVLDLEFVKKGFNYLRLSTDGYIPIKLGDIKEIDEETFCNMYAVWFMKNKGVISGRIIGSEIPTDCVPQCYIDVFNKALEMATL